MTNLWPALAEIVIGVAFCFFGFPFARFVLALWGAVLGFVWGVAGYAMVVGYVGGAIGNVAPWVFGLIGAVVLAGLAFAFYSVAVLLAMGSLGWGLGQLLASALHLPLWLSITVGVIVALGLVILGMTLNLPRLLLVLLTSFIGAGAIVDGVLLLLGQNTRWYDGLLANLSVGPQLIWPLAFLGLGLLGVVFQLRQHGGRTLRAAYGK